MGFEVSILCFNITIRAYNIILPDRKFDRLNYRHMFDINMNVITQSKVYTHFFIRLLGELINYFSITSRSTWSLF